MGQRVGGEDVNQHKDNATAGSDIHQHTTSKDSESPEQRALASFDHVARTGGAWGARLAALKTRELLQREPRNAR